MEMVWMQSVALLGVFLEVISHGSWKTSSTLLQFNLLPFIRYRLGIKFIVLYILLKFLSKREGGEMNTTQIMQVDAQLVKPYQTYVFLHCKQSQIILPKTLTKCLEDR